MFDEVIEGLDFFLAMKNSEAGHQKGNSSFHSDFCSLSPEPVEGYLSARKRTFARGSPDSCMLLIEDLQC